jgi:hypothetical protein
MLRAMPGATILIEPPDEQRALGEALEEMEQRSRLRDGVKAHLDHCPECGEGGMLCASGARLVRTAIG